MSPDNGEFSAQLGTPLCNTYLPTYLCCYRMHPRTHVPTDSEAERVPPSGRSVGCFTIAKSTGNNQI